MRKFADMPIGRALEWRAWARSHDWGHEAELVDGQLVGLREYVHDTNTGELTYSLVSFDNPTEMRLWAGY